MTVTGERPPQVEAKDDQQQLAGVRQVLRNRRFVLLWLAQLLSLTVFNAANFGLVVLVNDMTHSPFMAGLAIIAFTLPAIPFSVVAGVVVERMDKRLVLWVSNVLRALLTLLMVVSLLADRSNLWTLFALVFLISLVGQFFTPAEGAAIPLLVGERELMAGLALFNITLTLSMALGFLVLGRIGATLFPPLTLSLGGLTLHLHSLDMLFVVVAGCYLLCAGLIFAIPARAFRERHIHGREETKARVELGEAVRALWRDMVGGWRIVRADRLLYFSVIQLSVVGDLMLLIGQLAGPFVVQVMHRPAADMALIVAPAGVGLVGMSVLIPRISNSVERLLLTRIGFVALALGFVSLPVSQWLAQRVDPQHGPQSNLMVWLTIALMLLLGAAMACVNIPTQTIMQERAPTSGRARVLALQFMLYNVGSIPILLISGLVSERLGLQPFIVWISLALLLFCLWGARYTRDSPTLA